jgi:5-methylcytosine-specific restriction endonuclease McrA
MAGDWMKIELELPDKPEIHSMAGILNIDSDAVVGKLIRIWQWFDKHTVDGNAKSVTPALLDRITSCQGFALAMKNSGWLIELDDGLQLPHFDKHNGATAKSRAETSRRVNKHRAESVKEKPSELANIRNLIPRPIREFILKRDNHTCVYCSRKEGEYFPPESKSAGVMHIDHVIPIAQNGTDDKLNLVTSCAICNMFKSDRTPEECGLLWPEIDGIKLGNKNIVTVALPEKRREEKIKSNTLSEYSDEFEQFWKAYPKKTGKGFAYTAWKRQKPLLQTVLNSLAWQCKLDDWTKQNGQFVPMPATYLNQRRWDDPEPNSNSKPYDPDEFLKRMGAK